MPRQFQASIVVTLIHICIPLSVFTLKELKTTSSPSLPIPVFAILVPYPVYKYSHRDGLDNILVLLISGIPIAMPPVLSVTLTVGAQQFAKYKAIVTCITAIKEHCRYY